MYFQDFQMQLENGDGTFLSEYYLLKEVEPVVSPSPSSLIFPDTPRPKKALKRKAVSENSRDIFAKIAKQQADAMMVGT